MQHLFSKGNRFGLWACAAALFVMLAGCASPWQTFGLFAGATISGAYAPDREIEQIYYLGVYDPQEQVPPALYRIRVHGQASFISGVHFASGWVPAKVIDSLGGQVMTDPDNFGSALSITNGPDSYLSTLKTGRRLMMFGPEGFREAPRDHRLVIVMGASPEKYFEQIDKAMGDIGAVTLERNSTHVEKRLFEELTKMHQAHDSVRDLQLEVTQELGVNNP
jgi:hypothetical protein